MKRVYYTKNSVKAFWFVFLAFSLCVGFGMYRGISVGTHKWYELAGSAVFIIVGGAGVIQALTLRVVLFGDSITQGSFFRSRSIRRNQIRYRREYMEYHDGPEGGTNVYYLELVSRDSDIQSLKIAKDDFNFDCIFWDWVFQIPEFEGL